MQLMLAIAVFHANDSFPNPELDMFPCTSQLDSVSWNQEAATSFSNNIYIALENEGKS